MRMAERARRRCGRRPAAMVAVLVLLLIYFHGDIFFATDVLIFHSTTEIRQKTRLPAAVPSGLILGYHDFVGMSKDLGGLRRFLSSLRRVSNAEVVLFVSEQEAPREVRDLLSDFGATLMTFRHGVASSTNLFSFSSLRFALYKNYLADHRQCVLTSVAASTVLQCARATPPMIMTTDVGDVVFVSDPFKAAQEAATKQGKATGDSFLVAALEVNTSLLGGPAVGSNINTYWVNKCYGQRMVQRLTGKTVSCSGTTLGDPRTMFTYIAEMDKQMRRSVLCAVQGMDQGVHNVLVHGGLDVSELTYFSSGDVVLAPLETGPILTLDKVRSLVFDGRGRPVNTANRPYAVVHQVNRCRSFVTSISVARRAERGSRSRVSTSQSSNADPVPYNCTTLLSPPNSWYAA